MARTKKNGKKIIKSESETFVRNDQSVVNQLRLADEKYAGDPSILGISALSDPMNNNAMRISMFTSHTKQYVCLLNPDFPYYYMGAENIVGENNNAFKEIKNDIQIIAKLTKHGNLSRVKDKSVLTQYIITKDLVTGEFDVIIRKQAENLTEIYGYEYDNAVIDSYEEGDIIPSKTRIIQTTSYDEAGNYCYGKNVYSMYTLDPTTSEDACIVSESLAKELESIEIDNVTISINDNDYPLLLRSDENGYKVLPDIGEETGGVVTAVRTLYNNQALYDFKMSSLVEIQQSDRRYYLDGEVLDITIYSNNPQYINERNSFNSQIIDYYESQREFYNEFIKICQRIRDKGGILSQNLKHEFKRAKEMIDEEMKWRDSGTEKPFGGIKIDVLVRRKVGIKIGQKLTGRAGNKSVTASIRPDDEMPITDNGKRIDLLFNDLAIINRTTALPVHEMSITFICERTREKLQEIDSLDERESLFFDIMDELNPDESKYLHNIYNSFPTIEEKERFFENIIKRGINVRRSTLRAHKSPFFIIRDLEAKYDWLKPYDIYIKKFGRRIKCINPAYVGYMYIMKLKQTSKKGFSARGTGAINRKGLPERSYKNKVHQELYSSTAIRFGEYESLTFEIGVPSEDFALFHQRYRTSIDGRRDLIKQILDPKGVIKVNENYTNRAAEILNTYAKTLGFQFKSVDEENEFDVYDSYGINEYDGRVGLTIGTEWDAHKQRVKERIIEELLEDDPNMSTEDIKTEVVSQMYDLFNNEFDADDIEGIIEAMRYDK